MTAEELTACVVEARASADLAVILTDRRHQTLLQLAQLLLKAGTCKQQCIRSRLQRWMSDHLECDLRSCAVSWIQPSRRRPAECHGGSSRRPDAYSAPACALPEQRAASEPATICSVR